MRAFWICLVPLLLSSIQCIAKEKHAPLPTRLLTAKAIYIENHGHANLADRAYDELKKWGRFEIVNSAASADVVLQLSDEAGESSTGTTSSYDYKTNTWHNGTVNANTSGHSHMVILDPKTGESLYSDTKAYGFKSATRKMIQDLQQRIEEREKQTNTR